MNHPSRTEAGAYRGTEHLTESEYYGLLAGKYRRTALDLLATTATPVELDELAAAVAARETDANDVSEDAVDRVKLELHHVHLPKMDGLGVVDYDPATTRIDTP